jgi:hypothetical protein
VNAQRRKGVAVRHLNLLWWVVLRHRIVKCQRIIDSGENGLVLRERQLYATCIVDLSKYPLEKLFFFVAGIIPGFVALLIFQLAAPGSFWWFFSLGFLGYKTKLSIILLAAFIAGNSLTTFLSSLLGAGGGVYGAIVARRPYQPPHTYPIAPWRDATWRAALRRRLGAQTPNDTTPLAEGIFNIRLETINLMPDAERPAAVANLNREKFATEVDDANWAQWYDHYHRIVLTGRDKWDVQRHVMHGLSFNLETAALYTLTSALFVPSLRHWWCMLPASMWVLILVAQQFDSVHRFRDQWTTITEQIEYLSEELPTEK